MKRFIALSGFLLVVGCGKEEGEQASSPVGMEDQKESLRKDIGFLRLQQDQVNRIWEEILEESAAEPKTSKGKKGFPSSTKEIMFGSNPVVTEKDKAFWEAAKTGDLDRVKSLLGEGVDIDIYGSTVGVDFGCTALFWATKHNHKEVVEFLIENKAYIDAGAGMGGAPLHIAAYEGHSDIVELLISEGANVKAKTGGGDTVFDFSSEEMAELIRKSIEEGSE